MLGQAQVVEMNANTTVLNICSFRINLRVGDLNENHGKGEERRGGETGRLERKHSH